MSCMDVVFVCASVVVYVCTCLCRCKCALIVRRVRDQRIEKGRYQLFFLFVRAALVAAKHIVSASRSLSAPRALSLSLSSSRHQHSRFLYITQSSANYHLHQHTLCQNLDLNPCLHGPQPGAYQVNRARRNETNNAKNGVLSPLLLAAVAGSLRSVCMFA